MAKLIWGIDPLAVSRLGRTAKKPPFTKKELARIPLLKNWMELIHCLFLDRSDIKQGLQMILSGCEEIKSGTSICIFPEGTRGKTLTREELGRLAEEISWLLL